MGQCFSQPELLPPLERSRAAVQSEKARKKKRRKHSEDSAPLENPYKRSTELRTTQSHHEGFDSVSSEVGNVPAPRTIKTSSSSASSAPPLPTDIDPRLLTALQQQLDISSIRLDATVVSIASLIQLAQGLGDLAKLFRRRQNRTQKAQRTKSSDTISATNLNPAMMSGLALASRYQSNGLDTFQSDSDNDTANDESDDEDEISANSGLTGLDGLRSLCIASDAADLLSNTAFARDDLLPAIQMLSNAILSVGLVEEFELSMIHKGVSLIDSMQTLFLVPSLKSLRLHLLSPQNDVSCRCWS